MPGSLADGCATCDVLAGRRDAPGGTIHENAHWAVAHRSRPSLLRGYLMFRLRRHCECLAELTPEEAASLGPMVRAVCHAVSRVVEPERVYVCSWGEGVRQVHFHVIPRPSGMPAGNLPVSALLRAMLLLDRLGA